MSAASPICVCKCVFLHHRLLATSEPQCHMLLRPLSQQPPREEWVKWRKRGKNKRYSWEPSITWTYYEISLPFSYSNKVSSHQYFLFSSLSLRLFPVFTRFPLPAPRVSCLILAFSVNRTFPPHLPVQWQSSLPLASKHVSLKMFLFDWDAFAPCCRMVPERKEWSWLRKKGNRESRWVHC